MTDVTPAQDPEGTRERILAEAIDMFTRHGYHRTTLRLLADRLGVTKAAILYHFPAKDQIVRALMEPFVEAIEEAIRRAGARPLPEARLSLLTGVLDAYVEHQRLLLMARTDATIFTQEETYQRFMRMPGRVIEIIVGPNAPLEDKVWAVQLMGTLGDSVLFFGDVSPADLRAAIMRGTTSLLAAGPPSQRPEAGPESEQEREPFPVDIAWSRHIRNVETQVILAEASMTSDVPPGPGRRVGRPRALTGERITRAKEMHASGAHNVDDIAAELGVSRATVYRYLT